MSLVLYEFYLCFCPFSAASRALQAIPWMTQRVVVEDKSWQSDGMFTLSLDYARRVQSLLLPSVYVYMED